MQIKLNFTRKVLHLAWLWKWEFLKLGNNLLIVLITFRLKCIYSCFTRFSNTMATIATKKESNQNTVVWFLYYIMMVNNSCQTNKFQNSDQQFQRNRIFRLNRLNFISDERRLRIKKVVTYSQRDLSLVPIPRGFPLFEGDGIPLTRHLMVWFSSQEPVFTLIFHYSSIV